MVDRVFYSEEKEDLVLDDWAADVAAEVVEVYGRPNTGDPIEPKRSGIQHGVLEVVVPHAVVVICPAFADLVIDDTAAGVLSRERRSAHLLLGDGVEDRSIDDVVAHRRADGSTVQQGV